jgi:hypothetical protein
MAKRATEHAPPANPDVRFEREDVDPGSVLRWMTAFVVFSCAASTFAVWLAFRLEGAAPPGAEDALPEMAGEKEGGYDIRPPRSDVRQGKRPRRPPEPRLEAIDDLEKGRHELLPHRAEASLRPQREELEKDGGGVIPIEKALKEMKLPSIKDGKPAPAVPSKASAGRYVEGGQGE